MSYTPCHVAVCASLGCCDDHTIVMCQRIMQSQRLRTQLAGLKLPHKVLWVASPLSRAMQTMLLACPYPQLLAASCTGSGGCRTAIRSELSEHLMTTGDVGLPTSYLCSKFSQVGCILSRLSSTLRSCE